MKYRLTVSEGNLHVKWNDDIIIDAKDENEGETIALTMARDGKIIWNHSDYGSDYNHQVEECVQLDEEKLKRGYLRAIDEDEL